MKKNDIIKGKIEYVSDDYKGVLRANGITIYVPYLTKDDGVEIRIDDIKGNTAHGSLVKIIKESEYRIKPKCDSYMRCGSCKLRHVDYKYELELKKKYVENVYKKEGLKVKVNPVIGMESPKNYRNKVIASFKTGKGRIEYGMYEEDTHSVVYNPSCAIQNDLLNEILKTIKNAIESLKIRLEDNGGVLRHVMLRIGVKTNEVLVCFVTNNEMFPARGELVKTITKAHKEIKTITQNINPRRTSVVFGDRERILYGPGYIEDILLSNRYRISTRSFYQVNPIQTEKLYNKAIELAEIEKNDVVLDCYSGIGTIALSVSKNAKEVKGVEIVRSAVQDAITNAKANGIKNARFYLDDAKDFMDSYSGKVDCVFIDPPREGSNPLFLNALMNLSPRRIVYISCNPQTQARDITILKKKYNISEVYPVDMFPRTVHVECIVLLQKK